MDYPQGYSPEALAYWFYTEGGFSESRKPLVDAMGVYAGEWLRDNLETIMQIASLWRSTLRETKRERVGETLTAYLGKRYWADAESPTTVCGFLWWPILQYLVFRILIPFIVKKLLELLFDSNAGNEYCQRLVLRYYHGIDI